MKNPETKIREVIESKMNEIVLSINQTSSILEADKLNNGLRILNCKQILKKQIQLDIILLVLF